MARAVGREPRTRRRVPRPEEWQTPRETAEAWQGRKGDGLGIPFGCDSDHEEVTRKTSDLKNGGLWMGQVPMSEVIWELFHEDQNTILLLCIIALRSQK